MKNRRIGRFYVANEFLDCGTNDDQLLKFFSGLVVLHADRDPITNRTEYVARSDRFRPIAHGEIVPEYLVHVSRVDTGFEFEFEEIAR